MREHGSAALARFPQCSRCMNLAAFAGPLAVLAAMTPDAHADDVLVFGDHAGRERIATILTDAGHVTTEVETMPRRLDGFDIVWHVGAVAPLNETEQKLLAAFVNHGGGVYLTGDGPGAESMNASVQTIVAGTVLAGGVTLSTTPQSTSARHTFSNTVIGAVSATPNALYFWDPTVSGALHGVAATNELTHGGDGRATSAAWAGPDLSEGRGKLIVMMDSGWVSSPYAITRTVDNLARFLAEGVPASCGNTVAEEGETCDDGNLDAADGCDAGCQIEPDPTDPTGLDPTAPDDGVLSDEPDPDEIDTLAYAGCSAGGGTSGGLLFLALALVGLGRRRRR